LPQTQPAESSSTTPAAKNVTSDLEVIFTFEIEKSYLSIRTAGPINAGSLPALLVASAAAAHEHRCQRFFLDHRASAFQLDTVEIYHVPTDFRRHGVPIQRAAWLFSQIGEDERFLELVCINNGIHAKIFNDPDQALAWLTAELIPSRLASGEPKHRLYRPTK